jgi:hypothetical protein
MLPRLSRGERLALLYELCPPRGADRPCDSASRARRLALTLLETEDRPEVTADYLLMRAVDRYLDGRLSLHDLFRCRVLAYAMTFAAGGEEWLRWGVVAGGDAASAPARSAGGAENEEADDYPGRPAGPPWHPGGQ